jgi:hypothetical protein
MGLKKQVKKTINELLTTTIRSKLTNYNPETDYKPFHHRLLGKDRYAIYSFIQSINTTFGMSIWEQVAVILAQGTGSTVKRQYKLLGKIDKNTENLLNDLHYKLRKGEIEPDKTSETDQIRESIKKGEKLEDPDSTVDLFFCRDNEFNYFDITTVKPNIKEFATLKLKLLRWTALSLSIDKNRNVFSRLAIPYNPYYPDKYERWTLKGLYDIENSEILIGKHFWNFTANDDIYNELLDIFQDVGEELREEINEKFNEFKTTKD